MADPHILYLILAVDLVGLALWVVYVLVRMPLATPAHLADSAGAGQRDVAAAKVPEEKAADEEPASPKSSGEEKEEKPASAAPADAKAADAEGADAQRRKLGSYSDIQDD